MFDISQTEGEPLPEIEWPLGGECAEGLFVDLEAQVCAVERLDVRIVTEIPAGVPTGARGWYSRSEQQINVIEQGIEAAHVVTLLHELGHHFDPDLEDSTRQSRELVAESAAWLAGGQLGVGFEAEVEHYLASWQATPELLVQVAKRASTAAAHIMALMEADLEGQQEAA